MQRHRFRWMAALTAGGGLLLAGSAVAVLGDFAQPPTSPETQVGNRPYDVAAGDLNGDGHTDLAVPNTGPEDFTPDTVSILLGDGTGNFTEAMTSPEPVGINPQAVAITNLDGDSDLDLAVANYTGGGPGTGAVSILLNTGGGDFAQPMTSPETADNAPDGITAANLNGDSHPDLAVVNNLGPTHDVTILLNDGDGDGDFTSAGNFATGINPRQSVAADLDGDTKTDLAIANNNNSMAGSVTVLLGNGMGSFSAAAGSPVAVGNGPNGIAGADLDGDGDVDLAVPNSPDDTVTILLNNGTAGFTQAAGSPVAVAMGAYPGRVVAAALNGDSRPDLAVTNHNEGTVSILLNNGSAGFTETGTSPEAAGSSAWAIAAANINSDGALDLAVTNELPTGSVSILLNQLPPVVPGPLTPTPAPASPAATTPKKKCKKRKRRAAAAKRKCKRKKR